MATDVQHKDLTGAELHEPKGVDSASGGTVYVADGAGSGLWRAISMGDLDISAIQRVRTTDLTGSATPATMAVGMTTTSVTMGSEITVSGANPSRLVFGRDGLALIYAQVVYDDAVTSQLAYLHKNGTKVPSSHFCVGTKSGSILMLVGVATNDYIEVVAENIALSGLDATANRPAAILTAILL